MSLEVFIPTSGSKGMEPCMKRREQSSSEKLDRESLERGLISPYKRLKVAELPTALRSEEVYPTQAQYSSEQTSLESNKGKKKKLLQSQGQLKISAYMNFGLLTVHVIQGRHLQSNWKPLCDAYAKMSLVPDDTRRTRCKTGIVMDSNNPHFDEKFSFELLEEDHHKRLLVSVWHKDESGTLSEFLGCMSFGVKHLMNPNKEVNGWYYLLTEEVGRKKHLQVSNKLKSSAALKARNHPNIPVINKDVLGMEPVMVQMYRGKNGFGFSVVDSFPVKVGRVDDASPAKMGGLKKGDYIIKVNGQNVSRSTCVSVAKLVKRSGSKLVLDVQRQKEVSIETFDKSPWKPAAPIYESIHNNSEDDHDSSDGDVEETKENCCISVDDDAINAVTGEQEYTFNLEGLPTSTPLPLLLHKGHRTAYTGFAEQKKQEAVHRLLSLELDYIDFMHAGMQRYSRPLRHCILSAQQHKALFQNIEKLVTFSEYHIKQMQDNMPSAYSDTDTSQSTDGSTNFVNAVGLIYQSKVHMLCQAYETYASGLADANAVLSDQKRNQDFMRFVKEPKLEAGQPSISAFMYRPIQHIKELFQVLQEIYSNTQSDGADHFTLTQVVDGMRSCVNNITNSGCSRVPSLTSLSSQSKDSSKGCSMKTGSSSSASSSGGSSSSSRQQAIPTSRSMDTIRSVDSEVMRIQDRLVFSQNIPVFQLCQEERHLIFRGELFKWAGHQWVKCHMLLFSDVMLEVDIERDNYLHVSSEPMFLREICGMDTQRKHATEFVLHTCPKSPCTGIPVQRRITYRAPSADEKCTWKSLLEQRVSSIRGSHEYFSSSEISTCGVII